MKKLYLIFMLICLYTSAVNASIYYGIRGGVNFSSLGKIEESFGDFVLIGEPDNYFGFHIGGSSMFIFDMLYVQPELLFTSYGAFLRLQDFSERDEFDDKLDRFYFKQTYYKFDIPVNVGLQFGPLRIGGGPVYSIVLGHKNDYDPEYLGVSYDQSFFTSSLGFQVGAGLWLGGLLLDLKYEGGLTPLSDQVTIGETTKSFDARPGQIILSIGFLF